MPGATGLDNGYDDDDDGEEFECIAICCEHKQDVIPGQPDRAAEGALRCGDVDVHQHLVEYLRILILVYAKLHEVLALFLALVKLLKLGSPPPPLDLILTRDLLNLRHFLHRTAQLLVGHHLAGHPVRGLMWRWLPLDK